MAILDRFRSLPASKHPDPDVRLANVEALSLEEREELASIAREDENARVRRAAVGKLMDPSVLASIARDDADATVRIDAASMLRDIALEAFEETAETESLAAVEALADTKILSQVAKTATRESVARRALERLTDTRAFGSVARHAVLESVRRAAFEALTEHSEIVAVAMNSEFRDTAVAAVDRLTERADLEQVAVGSNNRSAAKRARGLLRELDQQSAVEVPDRRPESNGGEPPVTVERRQIVQRMERLASADNLQVLETTLKALEASWATLATAQPPVESEMMAQFAAAATMVEQRRNAARALEAERVRVDAEIVRRQAAGRAAAATAEGERARKDAERRRVRLGELADEIEGAANDGDLRDARRRFTLAQREWMDLTAASPADGQLAARAAAAEARLAARELEATAADARARTEALHQMHRLLGRVEPLTAQNDVSAKTIERAVRDVRSALAAVPPLPTKHDNDEITKRLKLAQSALAPKLQELRAIEDWQRWANVGIQEALCEKMEALKTHDTPEEIAHRVRDLQQQWRQAADVPRAQGEALWRRFKAAHDEVWARCEAYFAAEAQKRAENLAHKIQLCERVEALAESIHWIQTAEEIKRLQAEWKTVGAVSRGQEKAIWDRFRVACDRFFTRRHDDLVKRKATWSENLARKETLCVKAEALADSTDWDVAAAELKKLQAEWKTIGPVKKSRSDAIWQRFRGACDRFFARYTQRHEIAKGERAAAREAICAELEALAGSRHTVEGAAAGADVPVEPNAEEPPADLMVTVQAIRSRWQQELARRGVDPDRAQSLDRRFAAAHQQLIARWPRVFRGSDLDPEANRQRMEALVRRIESLASSLGAATPELGVDGTLSPTTRLAAMLKEALAANTIGGKVDEESRWRAAQEDVRQAQASFSRIGPVDEPARQLLTDQFQRACRRITDRGVGPARLSGASGRTDRPSETSRQGARSSESARPRGAAV